MIEKKKQRVLVVDDDESVRISIKIFLEDYNYVVLLAKNGRIGLDVFRQEKPDIYCFLTCGCPR